MEPDSAFPALTSGWKQRLTGTVILDNRRLTAPNFKWTDLNRWAGGRPGFVPKRNRPLYR